MTLKNTVKWTLYVAKMFEILPKCLKYCQNVWNIANKFEILPIFFEILPKNLIAPGNQTQKCPGFDTALVQTLKEAVMVDRV